MIEILFDRLAHSSDNRAKLAPEPVFKNKFIQI